ncbi:ArsR/SmtB family transcription factor [Paenibacillus sp. NPDC057886]|uniref:ArsR/SmtB family transcription factor n=1 Tax=Paenibacillus sp. NPDC057886 TaxID=3346270 RepID=UPI0036ABB811
MNKSGMDITTLSALAEPTRMNIVSLLREGPMAVGDISDRLELRQPQVSKHLKVLSDSGIVEVRIDANRRIYKLRSEPFKAMNAWLQSFRDMMEDRLDNLDNYLHELQNEKKT